LHYQITNFLLIKLKTKIYESEEGSGDEECIEQEIIQ
jgi:hypothetical protein